MLKFVWIYDEPFTLEKQGLMAHAPKTPQMIRDLVI